MLSISQLASYAGVTVRAVRHYHRKGLLPEPPRDHVGYRTYDGQALVELLRIKTLAGAGLSLQRVGELLHARDADFVDEVDRLKVDVRDQIEGLRAVLGQLDRLTTPERLCLPDEAVVLLDRERELGFSEEIVGLERDAWILMTRLYPEHFEVALSRKQDIIEDPRYQSLVLRLQETRDWDPDDPRLEDLADESVALMTSLYPADLLAADQLAWAADPDAYQVINQHNATMAPAWSRLQELIIARSVTGSDS